MALLLDPAAVRLLLVATSARREYAWYTFFCVPKDIEVDFREGIADATTRETDGRAGLSAAIKAMQMVTHPSEARRGFADEMLAENILHKELGYFSDPLPEYSLNQETRDRLLAHARQDAAHALIIVVRLSNEVKVLAGLIWTTRAILIGFMVLWSLLAALTE